MNQTDNITFRVEETSDLPIWAQLRNRMSYLIKSGQLAPGEQLPSVRSLAAEAKINYNTVTKAYRDLELSDLIVSVRGRGMLAQKNIPFENVETAAVDALLESCIRQYRANGIAYSEIRGRALSMTESMEKKHKKQKRRSCHMAPSNNKSARAAQANRARSVNPRFSEIETIDSPRTRRVDDNAASLFSAFVFVATFVLAAAVAAVALEAVNVWSLCFGFAAAVIASSSMRTAAQWERVVVLRLGAFNRVAGPGLFFTIPFVEHITLRADLRTMLTGFGAEEILTSDPAPVDVDAAIFWMVWDPEKACMEVENYYDTVSIAAQTALRDAIGCKSISDVTVHRNKLDQ